MQHQKNRPSPIGIKRRHNFVVVVLSALAIMASGCTTAPGADPTMLHSELVEDGFDLTWRETPGGASRGYEIQYREVTGDWTPLALPAEPEFSFRGAVPHTKYQFRVRTVSSGAEPASFGPALTVLYLEPVLPVLRITTDGLLPVLDRENYRNAQMDIDPNGSTFENYSGRIRVRGRGNSTWTLPKKPYRLKLDEKSELLGMPTHKDWVLLANHSDKSQIRTWTAAKLSESTDLPWTPRFRHVEVIFNGEYLGVYQLGEKIEIDNDRVDIAEMDEDDISGEDVTGGYLMEIDDRLEENNEPGWRTEHNVPVVVKDPEPMTPEQRYYIKQFVGDFEEKLFGSEFTDPVAGYESALDVDAFIDHWIVQEVTRNGDSFWSSTYFTKDRSEDKLEFSPIWDFDHSLDSQVTIRPQPPEGWYAREKGRWTRRLFQDPGFVDRVQQRWSELAPTFSALTPDMIDLGHELRDAISNDETRWYYELGPTDQPEHLADWLETRIQWMTAEFIAEG